MTLPPEIDAARIARRGVTRAHLRSWRARVWAMGLALVAVGLSFAPLFDVLGFELAFAMAFVGSIASIDLAAALARRAIHTPAPALERASSAGRAVAALTVCAIGSNLLLLIAPLAILSLNGLRVRNCDWAFGFTTYALMPVTSAVIASIAGVVIGLVAGRRRRWSNALPYLFVLASIGAALWRFYSEPPVFSYSWLVGYFPGNLYDEDIAIGAPFYWARLEQLAWCAAALAAITALIDAPTLTLRLRERRPRIGRWRAIVATAAALVVCVWLSWTAGRHGYAVDVEDLFAELDGEYRTEHFVIRYAPRPDIARDIVRIAEDHEFRLSQVVATLGVEPSQTITSFYFADAAQKARLMGAKNVYMAKPWRHEIYVHHDDFPHRVLRHEIAHVVAGEFGDSIFHVSAGTVLGIPLRFNVGLIEGLAVASDWPDHFDRALTPHQSVKAMEMLGYAPPVDALLSTEFLTVSSARSYTVAGSFVRFLLELHGPERLRVLYRTGGDFELAYGSSQREMIARWREMIDAVVLPTEAAEVVKERFRKSGIFSRPCPHAIASAWARAGELAGQGRLDAAVTLARRVCRLAPDEPEHELSLAELLATSGRLAVDEERRAAAFAEAAALYQRYATDPAWTSSIRAEALSALADMAAQRADWATAQQWLDLAVALPVEDDTLRNLEGKRFAVVHPGPAGPALRGYFWGGDGGGRDALLSAVRAAEAVAAEPELGLAHYLLGRNLRGRDDAGAVASLSRGLALGLPSPRFVRAAARLLAEAGYVAGDDAAVERAAEVLGAPDQPEVERLYADDWRQRVRWRLTSR